MVKKDEEIRSLELVIEGYKRTNPNNSNISILENDVARMKNEMNVINSDRTLLKDAVD